MKETLSYIELNLNWIYWFIKPNLSQLFSPGRDGLKRLFGRLVSSDHFEKLHVGNWIKKMQPAKPVCNKQSLFAQNFNFNFCSTAFSLYNDKKYEITTYYIIIIK